MPLQRVGGEFTMKGLPGFLPSDPSTIKRTDGIDNDALGAILGGPQWNRRAVMSLAALGAAAVGLPVNNAIAQSGDRSAQLPAIPIGRTVTLPSTRETVSSGVLDPSRAAAVTVDSGDVVHYPDTWTHWGNEAKYGLSFEEREPIRKKYPSGPYSNVGPVAVRGAEPGDVIELRWLKMRPIDWGWTSFPLGVGALPKYFDRPYLRYLRFDAQRETTEFVPGVKVPLAPFQGVTAVQPADDKPVSAILAGNYGGNLDLPEIIVGTSLFLPVQRPGGLVWTSDSNAAQGDGVICQTAIETAMEDMRIQYILHKQVTLQGPLVETPTHWINIGFGDSLDLALADCIIRMLRWGSRVSGIDQRDLYALYSVAASYRVTQYSNQTGTVYAAVPPKAVHGMLPKTIFSGELQSRIATMTRST
jgi:acetamidase/formamidase